MNFFSIQTVMVIFLIFACRFLYHFRFCFAFLSDKLTSSGMFPSDPLLHNFIPSVVQFVATLKTLLVLLALLVLYTMYDQQSDY